MLSPLRQTARRSLRGAIARPLSTTPSSSAIEPIKPRGVTPFSPSSLPSALPSSPLLPQSNQPVILNIPPAEDPLLHYIASSIQKHGNRKRASRIVSRMLLWIHTFTRAPPLEIVREAVKMASPFVRCMTHRHGAKNVAMPVALSEKQRTRFAVQWILDSSKNKSGQTLEERLAREIIAVIQGNSEVLKKKKQVHDFAMANRGNAETRV